MSLLTVSLLIDSLIPLVNSPALVKNEKKPFVLVQTRRIRMDMQAAEGWGGAGGAFSLVRRLCGLAPPTGGPWGGKGGCDERGLNSQSARVCLQFFMREVKHVSAPARSCSALRICSHVCAFGCKKMYRTKTQAKEVGEYV